MDNQTVQANSDYNKSHFKKIDILLAAIIGEFVALALLLIGKNIGFVIPYGAWFIIIFPVLAVIGLWISYLLAKRWSVFLQLGKFFLVGSGNTFIDFGILNFLIFSTGIASGIDFSLFKGLAFVVATTNSYFWNKLWTFQSNTGNFWQFLIVSLIGLVINVGIASIVVNLINPIGAMTPGQWANLGALVAIFVSLFWNFVGYKFLVFKK